MSRSLHRLAIVTCCARRRARSENPMLTRRHAPVRPLLAALVAAVPYVVGGAASAQVPDAARARPPRIYNTQRLVGPPPRVDGRLDDAAWKEGEWAGDY